MNFKIIKPAGGYARHIINAKGKHVGTWKHGGYFAWTLHFPDGTPVRNRDGYRVQASDLRTLSAHTITWLRKLTPANQARMKEAEAKRVAVRQLRSKCFDHAEEIRNFLAARATTGNAAAAALLKKLEAKS